MKKKNSKSRKKKVQSKKSTLKASDLKKFREMLLIKRREILGDVSSMEEGTLRKERSDLSNVPFHMADVGSDNFEMENTLGLMDEEIKLLGEIDAALDRIEKGRYGICEGSSKPIPKARLQAIPWARYSVEYAQLLEKGLVRRQQVFEDFEEDTETEDEIEEDREDREDELKDEETEEEEEEEEEEEVEEVAESLEDYYDDEDEEEEEKE